MKKLIYFILSSFLITCFSSCDLFKLDNFDQPDQTLWGEVVDKATGKRVLTDQGSEGIRVRLLELSWGEYPDPFDFYCKKEGEFQNTKLFAGTYEIQLEGPFIPLMRTYPAGSGMTNVNEYQTVDIKGGTTKVKFEVEPFLNVEWVGEPKELTGAQKGKIQCSFKVTRGVSEQIFRDKIQPLGGWNNNFLEVRDIRVFVSESASVGYRDGRDTPYQVTESFSGNDFVTKYGFGNTITIITNGTIPVGHTIFVRVGSSIRYTTLGLQRWNYNEAKRIDIAR